MQDGVVRYDIISDTHGHLSEPLLEMLEGADVIVHAGDCCSLADYRQLRGICRVVMCKGNNDWSFDYGPEVKNNTRAFMSGLRWQVCHYVERLDLKVCDIAICGHTHRPYIRHEGGVLVMNPGSPTYPRTKQGPTMGRILCTEGAVVSAEILSVPREVRDEGEADDEKTRTSPRRHRLFW